MSLDKLREVDWPICILCENHYHPTRTKGTLPCRAHPLPMNEDGNGKRFPRNHRECCGASDRFEDRHYEKTKPYGCLAIDHVRTIEDLRAYFAVPYFILKKEHSQNYEVLKAFGKRLLNNVIEIKAASQLDEKVTYPVYNESPITINLREVYSKISNIPQAAISGERVYFKTKDSRKYYTDGTATGDWKVVENTFEPFYIIRRCADKQDRDKLEEFDYGKPPCRISH